MSFEKPHPDKLQSSIVGLLSRLKTDSRHIISKYRALEGSESKLVDENRRLNSAVTSLEAENNAEKSNTNALRAKITVLTQQLLTKDQYVDSLLADERARWEGEVQRQQKVCEALQEELVRLKTSTFEWDREKDVAQRERTALQNKIHTLTSALETTTRETQEWRVAFDKAQTQKNEFLAVTAETMAQISDCAAKIRDMEAQEELRKKRVGELEVLLRERDLALSRAEAECVRMEGDKMVIEYELRRTRQQLDICRSRLSELIRKRREEATAMVAHMQERGHGRKETADAGDTMVASELQSTGNDSGSGASGAEDMGGESPRVTEGRELAYFGIDADMNMDVLEAALLDSDVEFEDIVRGGPTVKNEAADASPAPTAASHTSRLSEIGAAGAGATRRISSHASRNSIGAGLVTEDSLQAVQGARVHGSATTTQSTSFSFASSSSSSSSSSLPSLSFTSASSSMTSTLNSSTLIPSSSPTTHHARSIYGRIASTSASPAAFEAVPISTFSQEHGRSFAEDGAGTDIGAKEHAPPLLSHATPADNSASREHVIDGDVVTAAPAAMGAQTTPVALQNKRKPVASPRHTPMKRSRNENSADNTPIQPALSLTSSYMHEDVGGTWVGDGVTAVDHVDAAGTKGLDAINDASEAHKHQSQQGDSHHSSPLSHPLPSFVSTNSLSCVSSSSPDLCTDECAVLEKDTQSENESADVVNTTDATGVDEHGVTDSRVESQTVDRNPDVARDDDMQSDNDGQGATDTTALTGSIPASPVTNATAINLSDTTVTDIDAIPDETTSTDDTLRLKVQPQADPPVTPTRTVTSAAGVRDEVAEERVSVVAALEDVLIQMWDSPPTRRHARMVATVPTPTGPDDEIAVSGSADVAVLHAGTATGAIIDVSGGFRVNDEGESSRVGHYRGSGVVSRSYAGGSEDLTLSSASDEEDQIILIDSPEKSPTAELRDVPPLISEYDGLR